MVTRSVCLYEGRIIGIESIYTVIDGRQINIPHKVEELRRLGREKKLFCPCGCGGNLILVAGERNQRDQHFRMQDTARHDCHVRNESEYSLKSKIVLKCWLDDKLPGLETESRVPIYMLEDHTRRYEFSLLNRKGKVAVSYLRDSANLSDEKLQILDENASDISVVIVCDTGNRNSSGQYPEYLMKMQQRQGYCLFLQPADLNYDGSMLSAVVYVKNEKGLWEELELTEDLLTSYAFTGDGKLLYKDKLVADIAAAASDEYEKKKEVRIVEAKKREEENLKRYHEELEKRKRYYEEQEKRRQATFARFSNYQNSTNNQFNRTQDESKPGYIKEHHEPVKSKQLSEEEQRRIGLADVREKIARRVPKAMDRFEVRWAQCTACGEIKPGVEFKRYGANEAEGCLGLCKDCFDAGRSEWSLIPKPEQICPRCGSRLKPMNGPYGEFWGCSNYPNCKYSKRK